MSMGSTKRNVINCKTNKKKYSILIPAATVSNRMKKYGPKPLIKINNKTILESQISIFDKIIKDYEIIIIGGFEYNKIKELNSNKIFTVENKNYDETNVVYSIGLGLRYCNYENLIIVYGDLIFNEFALNTIHSNESSVIISNSMKDSDVGCVIHNQILVQMSYGIGNKWSQILHLKDKELDIMKKYCMDDNNYKCFGFEAINNCIDNKGKIKTLLPNKIYTKDIDSLIDIKNIKEII